MVETARGSPKNRRPTRLAYLATHPIQYQAPLLRRLAREPGIHLKAFFQSDLSVHGYRDPGFGAEVRWDVQLLDGYEYELLPALGGRGRIGWLQPWSYGLMPRLRAGAFDALLVHGYARPIELSAILRAHGAGLKVMVRGESTTTSANRSALRRAGTAAAFVKLRRWVDAFLAIGAWNRAYYVACGVPAERIFDVPYCVDNEWFRREAAAAAPSREALRARLGILPNGPVILFASKLIARKRPLDLIAAYRQLIAAGVAEPRPWLLMVGSGALEAEARSAAQGLDRVRFVGFRNQSELPALYDLCDVFVLPSEAEPWGLVVNEVMSVGRPVIVSCEVGCHPDLIRPGHNGHVIPVGDITALTGALVDVLATPGGGEAMGRRSRAIMDRWGFEEDVLGIRNALGALNLL